VTILNAGEDVKEQGQSTVPWKQEEFILMNWPHEFVGISNLKSVGWADKI
jgi:hypothetical protein